MILILGIWINGILYQDVDLTENGKCANIHRYPNFPIIHYYDDDTSKIHITNKLRDRIEIPIIQVLK